MRTFLKIVAGLVIVVVIAVVVVLLFVIDPNDYKGEITTRAEAAIGRQVVIDGNIGLRLGLTTALAVDGVSVANAPWAGDPRMLTVDNFAAEVAVLPLLRGDLKIKGLRLKGARILLERNEAGEANWEFAARDPAIKTDRPSAPDGPSDTDVTIPVVQEVTLEDVRVTFRDATTTQRDIEVALDDVRLTGDGPNQPLQLALVGSYNELPFQAEGELGAPSTLANNSPYPLNISAEALGLTLGIDGSIAQPAAATGINVRVTVDGEGLSGLAAIAGDRLPGGGPLSLATTVRGDPSRIELPDLKLAFGPSELSGNLEASLAGVRPKLTGSLQSPRIDLAALLPAAAETPPPAPSAGSGSTAESPAPSDERVLPDDPLPLEGLRAADVDLAVEIAELVTPGVTARDVTVGIRLDNGVLTVDPLKATAANSPLVGRIRFAAATDTADLDMDLRIPALDLDAALRQFAGLDMIRGAAAADISLQGSGSSVAAIAATLDGRARMIMEDGLLRSDSLDLLVSGLSGIFSQVIGDREEFTIVKCLALDAQFEQGRVATNLVLDTDVTITTAEGSINLANERLNLTLTPRAKKPTLNLAVPLEVRGSLANPLITPEPIGTATKIGGLIFPAATLLALADLGAEEDSCVREAAEEAKKESEPLTRENVEDTIKSIGKGLRNLFDH